MTSRTRSLSRTLIAVTAATAPVVALAPTAHAAPAPQVPLMPQGFQPAAPTLAAGRAVAASVLGAGCTAVFGYNDQLAIGCMLEVQAGGRRVPGDLSVVGFDNSSAAELVNPGLTSVAAPLHALGAASVRNVLAIAAGAESRQERATMLPTRLVERASTSTPAEPAKR